MCEEGEAGNYPRMPVLGEKAPDFQAVTTHGPLKLSDLEGSWVILFSHPADFTPVCTTEFIGFSEIYDDLKALNTQLVGLSIDSVHSHLAWVRNIKEKMGVEIKFPIIADLDMKVAGLYGMVHAGQSTTAAVRAVFFIDPLGILRGMLYYPLSNGRNMQEILRLLRAFQTSDEHHVATPANWQPGDKVIIPAPSNQKDMDKRLSEGYECKEFYLCFKEI